MGFNLCSIGSTCEELSKRIERHRADDRIYVDGKKLFTTLGKLMNMDKKMELIENHSVIVNKNS